jgi:hypothetical protein
MLLSMGAIDEQGNAIIDPSRNLKNVQQGAATQVWCGTSQMLDGMGGVYCENCDIAALDLEGAEPEMRTLDRLPRHDGVRAYALDLEAAERLWALSEKLA